MRRWAWLFLALTGVSAVLYVLLSRRTAPEPRASAVPVAASAPSVDSKTLRVRVSSQGKPFAGVSVQLFDEEHAALLATVTSNTAGVAVFEGLRSREVLALVEHPELERRSRSVELIAGRTEISMDLARGVTLRGVVSDEAGDPVGSVVVAVVAVGASDASDKRTRRTTKTDAGGAYVVAMLSPGSVRVEVTTGRHLPYVSSRIELVNVGMSSTHDVRLSPGNVLAGRVVDHEGKPVPGASVGSSEPGSSATTADAEGRFELFGLGDDSVNVFASQPGFAATHERGLRPGARGIELRLHPEASVRGRVVWPDDATELLISVCHYDAHFEKELCVARVQLRRPDADYAIAGLSAGRFDVVVEGKGVVTHRVAATLGAGVVTELTPLRLVAP
jgi:protocatechuate 3,4-dioxygenase beta subunit